MVAGLVLASVIGVAGQPVSNRHVRTTEARILALVEQGVARSATFRRLVRTLDESDVIVYVEPAVGRRGLAGYLPHNVTVAGTIRYLKIAVDLHAGDDLLLSVVAHELQHAVEVAEAPAVRDSESLARMFERVSLSFGCGGCYETVTAVKVQEAVFRELRVSRVTLSASSSSSEPPLPDAH